MQKTIEVKQLSVAFQSPQHTISAVEDVSFNLYPGETLVLLGESGCGKSITSLAMMRLLPQTAAYGRNSRLYMQGQDILNLPEYLMRQLRGKRLAMIFQEPMTSLNPVMTIGDQISEMLMRHHVFTASELKQALLNLLHEVEMPQPEIKIDQYPHQLSGGQKQRVMIAMALACKPDVLIADEPTTALDVTVQAQILALLKKLQATHQMSLLLITHDLGVARFMADRVCVMYAGQVVEQALKKDFFSYTGHPYIQQLMASIPSFAKREEKLSLIQGCVPVIGNLPSGCRFHPRCIYAFDRCYHEEPQLQMIQERLLRCHLYPDLNQLPPLKNTGSNEVEDAISDIGPGVDENELEDSCHPCEGGDPSIPRHNAQFEIDPHLGGDNREKQESESTVEPLSRTVLEVKNLSIHFDQKKRIFRRNKPVFKAVKDLSFTIKQGNTLALVGESGCGKTSTSLALLRLLPASKGEILFKNHNILTLKGRALRLYRKQVQIIFQDPFSSMNPHMTVREIIAEGMHAQKMRSFVINTRLNQLLDQVNLPSTSLDKYPHQFSGGQRQRICIARALATEPEILICDEPTSALDVSVQAQILNLLKELQKETQISYLFITHNMGVVSYIADEVLVMKEGSAVEYGTCEHVLKHPQHDYTRQLLDSVL